MPTYFQADRPLSITTPLGPDVVLLTGLIGREGISELFHFQLDLMAENETEVKFEDLLGQKVTMKVELSKKDIRHFSGIVNRISQSGRDHTFTNYRMEVVPQFWFLTKRKQSRIFQNLNVPDILKEVLKGLEVTYEIVGTFQPREFCVQYRESDFAFASRLMEEEGIFYFFKHTSSSHTMVLANTPQSHADTDPSKVIYEEIAGGNRPEARVYQWERSQELRSGKTTLFDHSFELPHKHLDAEKPIIQTVQAGTVAHKFKVGGNDKLELYDYPGGYAHRFDGVDKGGGERPADIQKIFEDNKRTVELRMQAEATGGLLIRGKSNCVYFISGERFTLTRHFNADGLYVLTGVDHYATLSGDYRSSTGEVNLHYQNAFTCIPSALPFRPPRVTPIPTVMGTQSAVVVGPSGEEIFTDKYGRIKVQFHWDRDGQNDGNSSCWLRVTTPWAGKQWGMIHIPRVGQEVIVDFLEGNPDNPIVVGSVYNAEQMPPYTLPDDKTQSGIKTRSSLKGSTEHYNEICFEDKKDAELLYIRAQKDQTIAVENDEAHWVGRDRDKEIDRDEIVQVHRDRTETVDNNETITIGNDRTETIKKGNETLSIKMGNRDTKIDMGNDTLKLGMGNMSTKMDLGKAETEAMQSIELKVGQSSIKIDQMGVTIKGMMIKVEGTIQVDVKGLMTSVKADAILMCKGSLTMIN